MVKLSQVIKSPLLRAAYIQFAFLFSPVAMACIFLYMLKQTFEAANMIGSKDPVLGFFFWIMFLMMLYGSVLGFKITHIAGKCMAKFISSQDFVLNGMFLCCLAGFVCQLVS